MGLFKKAYKTFETYEDFSKFNEKREEGYQRYEKDLVKRLEKEYKVRFEEQEKANDALTRKNARLTTEVKDLKDTVDVYEGERDKVRDIVKQQLINDDTANTNAAIKETLDAREAKLKDRESKIGLEEEGEYKRGYADGVSDGVRKINDITQKDRDNAFKVAMVSAASHTDPRIVSEINNVQALTAGTTDSEEE
jgi:cell division protein FtsB